MLKPIPSSSAIQNKLEQADEKRALTAFERYQLDHYGNILKPFKHIDGYSGNQGTREEAYIHEQLNPQS